jgi:hypothetical protein
LWWQYGAWKQAGVCTLIAAKKRLQNKINQKRQRSSLHINEEINPSRGDNTCKHNVRTLAHTKILKLLQENIEKILQDTCIGNDILNGTQTTQEIWVRIDQ